MSTATYCWPEDTGVLVNIDRLTTVQVEHFQLLLDRAVQSLALMC